MLKCSNWKENLHVAMLRIEGGYKATVIIFQSQTKSEIEQNFEQTLSLSLSLKHIQD